MTIGTGAGTTNLTLKNALAELAKLILTKKEKVVNPAPTCHLRQRRKKQKFKFQKIIFQTTDLIYRKAYKKSGKLVRD